MYSERFFDQTLSLIKQGHLHTALPMLAGKLYNAHADPQRWPETRACLHAHELHGLLLQDPFSAHSASRPRGYPGDAGLIDLIYDMQPPSHASELGRDIFNVTIQFQAPEGVRQRRIEAEQLVARAHQAGNRVLALACGHFREGDPLTGADLRQFTLVDQDAQSLAQVSVRHGDKITLVQANVFNFLRQAVKDGQTFDLIYTLGLGSCGRRRILRTDIDPRDDREACRDLAFDIGHDAFDIARGQGIGKVGADDHRDHGRR
jgi:hypothetical protein